MSCQRITCLLSACLDGELDLERRRKVERHLEECPACRREWAELRELDQHLRQEPEPAIDPFFAAQVMASLRPQPVRVRRWLPAAAYALVFAAVFLAGFVLQTSFAGQSAPPAAAATFSSVLLEPQRLGLMTVHDDTLDLFSGERP